MNPPVAAGAASVAVGLYAYALPFLVLAAWTGLALWDLTRRDDLATPASIGWTAAVVAVPGIGALAYHLVSGSPLPAWFRATLLGGGVLAYLLVLLVGGLVGGIV